MKNLSLQLERRYRLPLVSLPTHNNNNNSKSFSSHHISGLVVLTPPDTAAAATVAITRGEEADNGRAILTHHGHVVMCRLDADTTNNNHHHSSSSTTTILWDCDLNQVVGGDDDNSHTSLQQHWFQLDYVENQLVALQRAGAIVAINPVTGQAECVGEFEHGIAAAAWSPDGQVLMLVVMTEAEEDAPRRNKGVVHHETKSVLLTLNTQWEVLAEVEMDVPHSPDHFVSVAWRPDGTLCAVGSVDAAMNDTDDRNNGDNSNNNNNNTTTQTKPPPLSHDQHATYKLRIYQRDTLQLYGIGRTEDGSGRLAPHLQASHMAWAGPACSQLLATLQQRPPSKRHNNNHKLPQKNVTLFESNGLQHGEFVLNNKNDNNDKKKSDDIQAVTAMQWNSESDLLAIAMNVTLNTTATAAAAGGGTTTTTTTVTDDEQQRIYSKVQLWHRSNYHWYLKHEFLYQQDDDGSVTVLQFHPEHAYTLMVGFSNGQWREYVVRWHASTITASSSSSSTAVCIDGCQLQWTPLHRAIIPPPMSAATLSLGAPVSELAFGSDGRAVVLLSDGTLVVVQAEENDPQVKGIRGWKAPTVLTYCSCGRQEGSGLDLSTLRNLVVVTSSAQSLQLLGACWTADSATERLVVLGMSWQSPDGHTECRLSIEDELVVDAPILAITPWADCDQGALVELNDGQLLEWENLGSPLTPLEAEPLLEPCPWIAAIKFPAKLLEHSLNNHYQNDQQGHHHERTRLVFGKSARGRFYCHDVLLADSISSFTLSMTQQYLCYASAGSRCQLRFLPLQELANFDPFMGSDDHHTLLGYEPRNIERGSRLVAVFAEEPAAVLQMPRGNLEVIYPRALVLRHVMVKITEKKYSDAFETMRRQKVDLNLIVDMDPLHFLNDKDGAPLFVDQVQSVDYLNLFLSSLQNWNSTLERYPVPHWIREMETSESSVKREEFDFASKVNQVCQRMRSIMIEAERNGRTPSGKEVKEGDFLLPILSTFAKESPPKLEEALQLINENAIRHQVSSSPSKPPLFADRAQHSIQYLAFLAEYELLFDCALGLYDYDIARAVARNSQMDPKMYLPLIKRYRELPEFYARYEVDMRLRRYERALQNLAKSHEMKENLASFVLPPDQERVSGNCLENCMALIEEHGLHRLGLELFQDKKMIQRIMISLGDNMLKDRRASTALSVFLAAPTLDGDRAMQAAKAAREWRTYFSLLMSNRRDENGTDFTVDQQKLVAREIADTLAADAQGSIDRRLLLGNAAQILLDYGKDIVGAVDMLIAAEMWDEGQRIVNLFRRNEMEKRCLDAAVSYAQTTMMDLEDRSETFQKTMARYLIVLRIRKNAIASGEAEDLPEANEQDETGSLFSAASNVSTTSLSSTASTGSVGSLSSVISAKSTSSFSITGAQESCRHKSKFNQLGSQPKRKKKKNKRDRNGSRPRPGSHSELVNLVETLRLTCLDDDYRATIAETITFLSRNGKMSVARALFDSYVLFCKQLSTTQQERTASVRQDRLEREARIRREGGQPFPMLQVESEVESIGPVDLPASVTGLFAVLPYTIA